MKTRQYRSVRSEVNRSLLVGLFFAVVILVSNGVLATSLIRRETAYQYHSVLENQVRKIDSELATDADRLIMFLQNNANLISMSSAGNYDSYYLSMRRARSDFDTILRNSISDTGFFIRDTDGTRYTNLVSVAQRPVTENVLIEEYVRELDFSAYSGTKNWKIVKLGEKYYLFHVIRKGGFAVGSCVDLPMILQAMETSDDPNSTYCCLAEDNEIVAASGPLPDSEAEVLAGMERDRAVQGRNLAVRERSTVLDRDFYYIRENTFSANLQQIMLIAWITAFFMAVVYFLTYIRLSGKVNQSLSHLKERISSVREGNSSESEPIPDDSPLEFVETYELFDKMVGEIRDLKISGYESELQKRLFEIQFLSLQIEPHFYLNSMKYLYALAETGQTEVMQEIVLKLSDYFRYITYDSGKLVRAEEELHHAENYLSIVRSGSVNHIDADVEAGADALDFKVPKLLVQTFIENAVKYGIPESGNLHIAIRLELIPLEDGSWLHITVQDDGRGFSEEYLQSFEENGFSDHGGHIGLYNLYHRLELLYGPSIYMTLRNAAEGGALLEVMIPGKLESKEVQDI